MDAFIKRLKLKNKINFIFYISIFLIIALVISFHLLSEKINYDLIDNSNKLQNIQNYYTKINNKIEELNRITIEHSINGRTTLNTNKLHKDILMDVNNLKSDKYISDYPHIKNMIDNMKNTIIGYKHISDSYRDVVTKNYENGLYHILALSINNDTINEELLKIDHEIQKISKINTQTLYDYIVKVRVLITVFIIVIVLFMIYIKFKVRNSIIEQLKNVQNGVSSFFDMLSNKREDIIYMDTSTHDEISQIARIINHNMSDGKNIISQERQNAYEIERRVDEATQEIQKLNDELEETQREVVFTMGIIGEERSNETGYHVMRVAEYSLILARLAGLSLEESILIKTASPMHDIGKIGIPDAILNKPGSYTNEEYEIMKSHPEIGKRMLGHSNKSVLKAASIISYEHHEKWDGSGYPRGLKGEEIHIYGRITAIADVFDALGSSRVYKKAWPIREIYGFFEKESGKHFDPRLVELLLDNLEYFLAAKENIESEEEHISLSNFIQNFEKVDDYI